MIFPNLQIMVRSVVCTLIGLLISLSTVNANQDDVISFTKPLYHGMVQEKAVSSVVESDVMMGMWLTDAARNVRFDIVSNDNHRRGFQASKRISGNFVFLELRTVSVSQSQDVRIRALSPDFNQETFCTVRVHVKDVNDFQPLFPRDPYEVSISEDTKVGTVITHVEATDLDQDPENARFYYSLTDYTSDYFAVHPTTGAVFLTAPLNARTQSSHSVSIQATDRRAALAGTARPKRIIVTVTVNHVNAHSPDIVVHKLPTLDSGRSPQGSEQVYAILKVTDEDSGLNGQTNVPLITHCDFPGLLTVEPRRNNEYQLMFTRRPPTMNGLINVVLEVSDRGIPPRTSRKAIHVELFDKKLLIPTFVPDYSSLVVSEISPIFTQVGFIHAEVFSSDRPSIIRYSIPSGNEAGYFNINQETSLITTTKSLERRSGERFNLTIAAVNTNVVDFDARNSTLISIVIEDANNHDPTFNRGHYQASIAENAPIGSVVTRVYASDEDNGINGTVVYSLIDSASLPFAVDPFNGTIYTTASIDSDVLGKSTFDLRVRAHDSGLPFTRKSECLVSVHIVNMNDNPPVFNEVDCALTVPISTSENSTILQLQPIDIDRNPFTCKLLEGGAGWFKVTATTCELQLVDDLSNTENGRQFFLQVTAFDGKHTSDIMAVNVTISPSQNQISKVCRDTGAIRRFEDSMNNLHLSNSLPDASSIDHLNSTSQLPNRHKPKILPYSIRPVYVSENLKLHSVVIRIRASDRDTGYNGKLWYTITAGNDESCFAINTETGFILLARPLDRERRTSYNLTVKVSDLGRPSRTALARIKIFVTDVNDNAPVFSRSLYTYEIPENVSVGYQIRSQISAKDIDAPENARIRYSFSPHSIGSGSFFINPLTGFINVTKGLDRETVATYNLTVIATDSASSPLTSSATVFIRLIDVNDNAPKFFQPVYRIRIAEDLPVHAVIFWLQAQDADEGDNGIVRYSLTDGVSNRNDAIARFHVDDRTGAIRLSAKLDSRIQNRYNITARARDSKKYYSTCYIEVEVLPVNRNLHAPYFENPHTRFEVPENSVIGTNIGTVSAVDEDKTDPERDVGYYIVDGTGLGFFDIDQNTGVITTLRTLDRESEQYYWITVLARDRASVPLSGHMFVLVEVTDVNDNAPRPTRPIYFASVLENSPIGTTVIRIEAVDKDAITGGNITYNMPQNKYFKIDHVTGVITTTVKKRLDREKIDISQLSFDVTISDGESPSLSSLVRVVVNVTDQNDNSPKFYKSIKKKIVLPARNKTETLTPIARVVAFDADAGRNADIDYVLDHSQKFTISPKSGIISTSKAFKPGQTKNLKVSAFDLGDRQRTETIRLQLSWVQAIWTRNAPEFVESVANQAEIFEHVDLGYAVDESLLERTVCLLQATDIDSDQLWLSIVDGNEDNMFDIDGSNALYVAGEPDVETKDFYNLTIEVTDGYNKAYKQISISVGDFNDHRPEFSEAIYYATIDENSPVNQQVVQLEVSDGDQTSKNRHFIFKIRGSVDPSSAAKFRITSDGTIYTIAELDREAQRQHTLFVEVDDQGVPGALQAYCQVVITVADKNEHAPQFTSSSYFGQIFIGNPDSQIGTDESLEKVVVRVRATDRDFGENARIFYSIGTGNPDGFWKINPSTGEITTTKNLQSRSESTEFVTSFVVKATDGGKPALLSSATVTVDVKRHSSAIPRFESNEVEVSVSENAAPGSFVTMVTASASSGVTYSFGSGNIGERFRLNPHSGVISLAENLDREQQEDYHLVVLCISTEGMQATSRVTVHVTDVNDNRPRFLSPSYVGYVFESNSVGSTPITDSNSHPLVVSAVDRDTGNNARIAFSIVDSDSEIKDRFIIDSDTGAIRAETGIDLFDYETKSEYTFEVQCFDLGNPRLFSEQTALVTIHVKDANDTVPVFTQSQYNLHVLLPTAEGVIVSRDVHALQPDPFHKMSSWLMYSISGGRDHSAFQMDSESGLLSVFDQSILEAGKMIELRVRVTDGKKSSAAKVTITVSSVATEDGWLFTRDVYDVTVTENSTEIESLIATHISGTELDDNVRFQILNPIPSLQIGSSSGVISTTGVPLDREIQATYVLLLEAVDINTRDSQGQFHRRGRCKVRVNITDVNDCSPQFIQQIYYATMQVDAEPHSVVKQVKATDADLGVNGVISYSVEGKYSRMFDVDSRTGVVTSRRTPDVNVDGGNVKFNVTLLARDMGIPSLTSRATLIVSVINRATPVFSQQFYGDIMVSEDVQPHTVVSDAVKASSPDGSDIYFTIEDGDPLQQFDIDFETGTITTRGTLDHEKQALYRLRVRARDSQSRAFAYVEVEVGVADVNDHTPVFDQSFYSTNLPETAGVGTTVFQVKATDQDSGRNGHLAYVIEDSIEGDGDYFHIDQDTGVIWTARELYSAEKRILSFIVRASDYGAPVRHTDVVVTLQIDDVNNNQPLFEKDVYEFEISDQAKRGQFVGKVVATDQDSSDSSRLSYFIPDHDSTQLQVDSSAGVVSLAADVQSPIITNVTVTDGIYSASVRLMVRLATEDTTPVPVRFDQSMYTFAVEENQPASTNIGRISASGSGRLNYRIETETSFSDLFRLNSRSGLLQTAQVIDREAITQVQDQDTVITFAVTATDNKGFVAQCKVKVEIHDENDNAPIFSQAKYSAVLIPGNGIKDSVINITAFDTDLRENGRITYSWYEAPPKVTQVLSLDMDEGEIKIRDNLPFGTTEILQFFVQANDHGVDTVLTNIVPVSIYLATDADSVPRFTVENIATTVTENEAVGIEVAVVEATVESNLEVEYLIAESYDEQDDSDSTASGQNPGRIPKFSIDASSGRITTLSPLDREEQAGHEITVLANVKTTPQLVASTKVFVTVLDANDNSPAFTSSEYRASIVENSPENSAVIAVRATDLDAEQFGIVQYRLLPTKDHSELPFEINPNTGVITAADVLDREVSSRYNLVVEAIDGGEVEEGANQRRVSNCHVIVDVIDVNDSPPVFLRSFYQATISEGVQAGHTVSSLVKVKDGDSMENTRVQFYIIDGDINGHFEMVAESGSRGTTSTGMKLLKKLDREEVSSYSLTILATDGLHSNTTNLRIDVGDINDNAPVCQQLSYYGSVSENVTPRSFVLRVHATDLDVGDNGRITYEFSGEGMDAFSLNSNSGELFTATELDREVTPQYQFIASATDSGGQNCQMKIFITVDDVNDNSPQLLASSLSAATRENTPVNSLIHRVNAKDSDEGSNSSFVFSLLDDVNGQFFIEPNSGVVVLMKPLDRETVPSYQLRIKVRDRGNKKRLSSTGMLKLNVLDINDNPPIFDHNQYETEIGEDASPGHLISRVSAKSIDTGANARLRYFISGGNEHGKFNINPQTGEVRLLSRLDYETDQSYVLKISASDLSDNPLSSECSLRVNITDVNDNAPEFTSSYQETVPEDTDIGHVIVTVSANDQDSGSAGNVTYRLSASNDDDLPFQMDLVTGKLTVTSPGLDYEKKRFYRITVTATDSGSPPLHSDSTVQIFVGDVNDNRPIFAVTAAPSVENNQPVCLFDGANCTVFVHESSTDAVTHGIVLLNATDADGEENGGPFQFRIKKGNERDLFYLDQNNVLKARRPLKLDSVDVISEEPRQLVHRVKIGAKDNGKPVPLSSNTDLILNVVVLKKNQYPPEMAPHYVQIATPHNEFEGDVIAQKLHATDRDRFDQSHLRFSMASPDDFERFIIDPLTGSITSLVPLETGVHNITVRVSDGSRYTNSTVSVNVIQVGRKALESSVSITFFGIDGVQEYLSNYHSLFMSKLASILPFGVELSRDLVVMSLQEIEQNSIQLLFGIRNPSSKLKEFYSSKALKRFLETSRQLLTSDESDLQVTMIEGTTCAKEHCEFGTCSQIPSLDSVFSVVSTNTYSLVSPSFKKKEDCVCPPGSAGQFCKSICSKDNNPCPKNRLCVVTDEEAKGYRCDSAQPTNSIMAFGGHSFAQYSIDSSTPFQISMRLRTFQSNSTIFYAIGPRHFARLETSGGLLQFTFDCGSGPQTMKHGQKLVNDGKWLLVDIESRQDGESNLCAFKMTITIDETYIATTRAPDGDSNLDITSINFGGMPLKTRGKRNVNSEHDKRDVSRNRVVKHGYRGCMKEVHLNGLPFLPTSSSNFKLDSKKNVLNRCPNSAIDMGACDQSPCRNGGRCLPLSDGLHECECPDNYYGDVCENLDPCGSSPCSNKGYCYSVKQSIQCVCISGYTGSRCEIKLSTCQPGWVGQQCEIDVNECEIKQGIEECGGKEKCFNYDGGFACNCMSSKVEDQDSRCKMAFRKPKPNEASPDWVVIGAIIGGCVVVIVAIVLIVFCVRKRRKRKDDVDSDVCSNFSRYGPPPRIPPPPSEYHRSSRDSFNLDSRRTEDQEQRNPLIVYVQPQLPASPQSMSAASDSDSMRKPSPSWPDYDPTKYNESTTSSMQHYSAIHKTSAQSIPDQQSYDWDVTDWKLKGSGVVPPSVARVALGPDRVRGEELPSSPTSLRSAASVATSRSSRSHHRTDALAGHYNKGRIRREKQIFQMLTSNKPTTRDEEIELQRVVTTLVNRLERSRVRNDSRTSSLRSASSRYQHGFQPLPTVEPSYPSSPQCASYSVETHSSDVSDEYQQETQLGEHIDKVLPKFSENGLPPPPSDYELQVLRGDDDDDILDVSHLPPATSNKSYSSLLNSPYDVDLPTPAVARSVPFHPGQHMVDHFCNISDLSLASEAVLDDGKYPGVRQNLKSDDVMARLEDTPSPPQRHDSERLAMSSLSDDEETEFLRKPSKQRHGRPPLHPKAKSKKSKKKSEPKQVPGPNERFHPHPKRQDRIFLERPSPGTTDV